jgi:hypothetical protein
MQLVAHGAQDVYLTGNADITFFKVVYRRHTNFAVEAIEQTFNGTADFGRKVSVTVSRNADLITRTYLQVTLPAVTAAGAGFSWVREIGHFLINNVTCEIGGQQIDKHYGEWLSIWNSLTLPVGKQAGYDTMIGNVPSLVGTTNDGVGHATDNNGGPTEATTLYIPLQFWFNRNAGLALPLIALQYHEVKICVEFATYAKVHRGTASATPVLGDASLYVDYVYLARDERRRFAQSAHEYLIEQLQFHGDDSVSSGLNHKIKLNFNHPVKELIWVVQKDANVTAGSDNNQPSNWTMTPEFDGPSGTFGGLLNDTNPVADALIQLNGHDRFSVRAGTYFNVVQPYQHHTNTPATGINVYSFCEKPEEHQPTGSANFSRIDNANLLLTLTGAVTGNVRIYALNYNVLRIMSGMGGLAFAN